MSSSIPTDPENAQILFLVLNAIEAALKIIPSADADPAHIGRCTWAFVEPDIFQVRTRLCKAKVGTQTRLYRDPYAGNQLPSTDENHRHLFQWTTTPKGITDLAKQVSYLQDAIAKLVGHRQSMWTNFANAMAESVVPAILEPDP